VLIASGALSVPSTVSFVHIVSGPDPNVVYPLATALSILFSLNVLLGVFNLIPVPPLDGAAVLGLVLPPDQARSFQRFMSGGPMQFLGIFIAWQISKFIFHPAFVTALRLLYPSDVFH
jgi:Zn-dependent protease